MELIECFASEGSDCSCDQLLSSL